MEEDKKLAKICIEICKFSEKHSWYNCYYAKECLMMLEEDLEIPEAAKKRIQRSWNLLVE